MNPGSNRDESACELVVTLRLAVLMQPLFNAKLIVRTLAKPLFVSN
jgi:hypothetical protein